MSPTLVNFFLLVLVMLVHNHASPLPGQHVDVYRREVGDTLPLKTKREGAFLGFDSGMTLESQLQRADGKRAVEEDYPCAYLSYDQIQARGWGTCYD